MADPEDIKKLELRISRLESVLEKVVPTRQAVDISAEEMKTYQKVRDVVAADWGDFCGINDCFRCIVRCFRCFSCYVCRRCDVECICGPCNPGLGAGLVGGLSRFSGFGE